VQLKSEKKTEIIFDFSLFMIKFIAS